MSHRDLQLKILQWNIRSVNSNYHNLINFIGDEQPDVVFLNETWLKKDFKFRVKHFKIVRNDRLDGKGGVATLIKDNLDFEVILNSSNNLNGLFQYIKIKIGNLYLVNIYNAPNNVLDNTTLNQVFKINKEDKLVIMGDLNAHHQIWGSNKNNINGLRIVEYINKYNYIILNESISTRMNRPGENISPLDLTIVSQNISCISEWKILNDLGNSDHFPTVCSIGNSFFIQNSTPNILKRNYSLANWEDYSDFIESSLSISIQNSFDNLMELIKSSADKYIPFF